MAVPITGVPGLPRGERLLSDERLAKLAGRGNTRAFAALYERNHQAIYRYCRSILRHDHDAQDALQSTMMRAYAALRAHERDLAVRPWLFRIAHNEAISILRKRRPSEELDEDREHLGGGVEGAVEVRERLATLVADLQALPERQRAALLMRELSGLSIEEIAGALEVSRGAAKQTLFEARGSLHELSEGRAMRCEAVRQAISDGDRRVMRGRRIRAHLRACEACRSFQAAIETRSANLHALAPPLPAFAAGTLLARLLAQGAGHSGGAAVSGTSGASFGGHAVASLLTKGLAGVTVVAAAAAGTVHLTSAPHHRGGVTGHSASAHARSAAGGSSTAHPGAAAESSPTIAKPHTSTTSGSRQIGAAATGAAGARPFAVGGLPAQTSISARLGQHPFSGAAHNRAAGAGHSGAANVSPTGQRHAHHQTAAHSQRPAKARRPASSRTRTRTSTTKSATSAGKAPAYSGNDSHAQSKHEAAGGRAPASTTSTTLQTTPLPVTPR